MILANITPFMTWWINLIINTFTTLFNILDSFEFMGTTLLEVIISIVIISAILPILLTLANTITIQSNKAQAKRDRQERRNYYDNKKH